MCGLLFAVHPSEKAVPGNQVGSADDLAGQLPGADGTAQGVLADVDAGGVGAFHGLLMGFSYLQIVPSPKGFQQGLVVLLLLHNWHK